VGYLEHLWLFFIILFSVIVMPGMDMAYILGSALTGGIRMVFIALAGIVAGAAYHVTIGTLGIGVVLKLMPSVFNLMLLAGSMYIAWIGWSILKHAEPIHMDTTSHVQTPWATFRRGVLTNMLNPKAYLFTLAIYPQFLRAEYGPLATQALVMWVIIALTQLAVYGAIVLAAHGVRGWFASRPDTGVVIGRVVGVTLILSAAWTAFSSWKKL
jgi:threonine/homoserine/homoserine lactone efflux protein